ncbi:uncharacterized protein LAJ45_00641 [Morchella importuna]|nr:uncharacterized protein LAJ45_00641 [Morchella importuna]KAH8155631.1 hypothetical protein LAJ45_00641 [Morchella importuna]
MRINESDVTGATTTTPERQAKGGSKRWSMKLRLKERGEEVEEGTEAEVEGARRRKRRHSEVKGSKNYFSFFSNFRQSYNAKFTILSLVLMVLLMTGSAVAAPTDSEATTTATATTTESATSTSSEEAAATTTVVTTVGTIETPTLFDTVSIASNSTTTTCPIFFSRFLSDPQFQKCLPLSGLLLSSQSYFEITKEGGFATTQVVDQTCNVDVPTCQLVMEKLGWQIGLEENCGADLQLGNPVVQQARAAFISYKAVYLAGCLKSDSGSYCYVDALMNVTSPSDSYVYYLPLGQNFPGGARPTCSDCLSNTLRIYSAFAGNSSQPLYDTYTSATQQINMGCGPDFSNTTVQFQMSNSGRSTFSPAPLMLLSTLLVVIGLIV